jgi:hypothetical protein
VSEHLEISPERGTYAPGDRVVGTVVALESINARDLTIALEYRDWTSDYRSVSRSIPHETPLHTGDLEQGATFHFAFTLPSDSLPNQSGMFGSTSWGLHARINKPGLDSHTWHLLSVAAPLSRVSLRQAGG